MSETVIKIELSEAVSTGGKTSPNFTASAKSAPAHSRTTLTTGGA